MAHIRCMHDLQTRTDVTDVWHVLRLGMMMVRTGRHVISVTDAGNLYVVWMAMLTVYKNA